MKPPLLLFGMGVLLATVAMATPGTSALSAFGVVGDGEHDDTEALQRAVAAGPLTLGRGVYRITAPIVIDLARSGYSGVTGDGGTARIVMAGAGPALHLMGNHLGTANPDSVGPGIWERERFPVISGIEIVGEHPEAEGIRLERTMQCTISRVAIRNCLHGIRLVERNRNLIVSDSHIYENFATGIYFDHVNLHQVNITGNHISYSGKAGILVRDGEIRNIQITGNDIEYNYKGAEGAADILFDTREGTLREFTIASNTIQARVSDQGANIRIWGAAAGMNDQSGLGAITGNLIGSQTINIDLQHTRGISITGNSLYSAAALSVRARHCHNLALAGNTVDYNPGSQERMRDGFLFESCDGVTVSGGTFLDCRWGDGEQGGAITIRDSRTIAVSDCLIQHPAWRGIDIRNSAVCRITNNTIVDNWEEARMVNAIAVDDASTEILIEGNLIPEYTPRNVVDN